MKHDPFETWRKKGELVEQLAFCHSFAMQGFSSQQIADELEVDSEIFEELIKNHEELRNVIERGRERVVATLQNELIRAAKSGSVRAIIYGLQVYGGDFFNPKAAGGGAHSLFPARATARLLSSRNEDLLCMI